MAESSRTDSLGIGLVGTGFQALKHADAIKENPRARLVSLWSTERSASAAEEIASRLGFEGTTTDYEQMLADPEVDLVMICSPDRTHPDFVIPALEAGKHVFCEKPLAQRGEDFERIADALERSGRTLGVGMNSRYRAQYRAVKDAVSEGELGELRFARGTYVVNAVEAVREGLKSWILDVPEGVHQFLHGGGTHILDLLRWLAGPIESVFARGTGFELGDAWDLDTFSVSLRFESGAIGEMLVSASAFRPGDFSLECWLEQGSVGGGEIHRRDGYGLADPEPLEIEQPVIDLALQFEDLVEAIDAGSQPLNSFDEAMRNYRAIAAIEESMSTGEPVTLSDPA